MQFISMIISFIIYPFYSSAITLRDLIREKWKGIDFGGMQDSFYVMSFFMIFSKYIILFSSVLVAFIATYISKEMFQSPTVNFLVGLSFFIITYWIVSVVVFLVQTVSWLSTTIRKVSKDVEHISRRSDEEIKKIVH